MTTLAITVSVDAVKSIDDLRVGDYFFVTDANALPEHVQKSLRISAAHALQVLVFKLMKPGIVTLSSGLGAELFSTSSFKGVEVVTLGLY